jgi:predicted membrane channel-forming protein YqfA (hemolysin III family)
MSPKIDIKWSGSSVCGLVVIAGIICILLSVIPNNSLLLALGVFFIILGLVGALFMTAIIRGRFRF